MIDCIFPSKKLFYLKNQKHYKFEVITSFPILISVQYHLILGRWRETITTSWHLLLLWPDWLLAKSSWRFGVNHGSRKNHVVVGKFFRNKRCLRRRPRSQDFHRQRFNCLHSLCRLQRHLVPRQAPLSQDHISLALVILPKVIKFNLP